MSNSFKTVRVVCMACKAHLSGPADSPLISHGIGPCCWDAYRVAAGLAPKPFPVAAR